MGSIDLEVFQVEASKIKTSSRFHIEKFQIQYKGFPEFYMKSGMFL